MPYLDKDGLDALWTKIKANFGHTLSKTSSSTAVNIALKTTSNGTLNSVDINKSDITALGIPAADTHYTSKNVAGATSSATANAAASNGSVYLNSFENGAVTSANLIKGTGATTVTSAADGTITVNSTDTKYTLPTASASTLGGVKVGDNLSISSSGVLSAARYTADEIYCNSLDDDVDTLLNDIVDEIGDKVSRDSPSLIGIPTAPTAAAGTSSLQIATTAFVSKAIASEAVGHAKYQGGITPTTYAALKSYKQGWYWVVTTAGTIAGEACEIGDMVFCNTDSASGATAPTASHFDVVQNNIDAIEISYIENLS